MVKPPVRPSILAPGSFGAFVLDQLSESRGYYEVPIEILESPDDLVKWARAAQRTPPLTARKRPVRKTPRRKL